MKKFFDKWALVILALMGSSMFFILADVSTNSALMNFIGAMFTLFCLIVIAAKVDVEQKKNDL